MRFWKKKKLKTGPRLSTISYDKLPPEITAKLLESRARIKSIIWTRGILAVLAAAIISVLAIMAIDVMMMIFSPGWRWLFWAGGMVATGLTAMYMLVRPLSRPFTPARVALLIEQNHPELEERLSTVVQLLSDPETQAAGSSQLLAVLTTAAVVDAKAVSPRQAFTTRTIKPKLVAAASAVAILAFLFLLWPRPTARLFVRAVMPSAEIGNVYADNLSVDPGDIVVLKGSPLTVGLVASADLKSDAYFRTEHIVNGKSREIAERMRQLPDEGLFKGRKKLLRYGHFIHTVNDSFRYRVLCGGALSRFYNVTAVPTPAYESISITKTYPEYTGKKPSVDDGSDMRIESVVGTRVDIEIEPERELKAKLILPDGSHEPSKNKEGKLKWSFTLGDEVVGNWRIDLSDAHGFTNAPRSNIIKVIEDRRPNVAIVSPNARSFTLPPFETLPVEYVASDDFGLVAQEIHISRDGGPYEKFTDTNPTMIVSGSWTGTGAIDLSRINTHGISLIRAIVVVRDNLPPEMGGPQEARSVAIEIKIERDAQSLAMQFMEQDFEAIDSMLENLKAELAEAAEKAEEALQKMEEGADDDASEILAEADADMHEAEEKLNELIDALDDSLLSKMQPELEDFRSEEFAEALEQSQDALLAEQEDRKSETEQLRDDISKALDKTEELSKSIQQEKDQLENLMKAVDLADRQQTLADTAKPDEMSSQQLEDWKAEQKSVEEALTEAKIDGALEPMRKATEEIASEIRELAEEQKKLEDIAERLGQDETHDEAKAQLEQMTPEMSADATPEERAQALEEQVSETAEALNERLEDLAEGFDKVNEALKGIEIPQSPTGKEDQQEALEAKLEDAKQEAEAYSEALESASEDMGSAEAEAGEAVDLLEQSSDMEAAAEKMEAAAEDMDSAAEKLDRAKGNVEELAEKLDDLAKDLAQRAKESMETAGEEAGELAEEKSQGEGEPMPPEDGPPGEPMPPEMGGDPMPPSEMADNAQSAAEDLRALAELIANQMGYPEIPAPSEPTNMPAKNSMESDMSGEKKDAGSSKDDGVPERLRRAGLSDLDWFRFKSGTSTIDFESALHAVPEEYRELVRAYFLELAKERD